MVWKLRLAVVLYAQQKYPQTADWTEKLVGQLKQPAAVAEAQFLLGASQFSQDKYPAAVTALQAALVADATWRQADETLLFLSRAQHKVQQLPAATGTVQKLIKDFPKSRVLDQADYLAGGIYAALVTTLGGLMVAIPAAIFAHYFELRIQRLFHQIDEFLADVAPLTRGLARADGSPRVHIARRTARSSTQQPPPVASDQQSTAEASEGV